MNFSKTLEFDTVRRSVSEFKRILFLRYGGIGDFILSIPLLWSLRKELSLLPITLIAPAQYKSILYWNSIFTPHDIDFIPYDHEEVKQLFCIDKATPFNHFPTINLSHAWVIIFGSQDKDLETKWYRWGAKLISWIPAKPQSSGWVAKEFCNYLGVPLPPKWPLSLFPFLQIATKDRLTRYRLGSPCLWIHPGSGSPKKNMPISFFVDVAQKWYSLTQYPIRLSFGEADTELVTSWVSFMQGKQIPYEVLILPTLAELINQLTHFSLVYLGNDSGVSHLAAYLGIPTVTMFICTNPSQWAPRGNVIVGNPDCTPDEIVRYLLYLSGLKHTQNWRN